MNKLEIEVSSRNVGTRSALSAIRNSGKVPGVVYGAAGEPEQIAVDALTLRKVLESGNVLSRVFSLKNSGSVSRVIIREVQFHPTTCEPWHVDFMRIDKGHRLTVKVPINCMNGAASPALKQGGVLNVVLREIDLLCDPDKIPETLDVDLTGMDFHHTVKLSNLNLPDGCSLAVKLPLSSAVVTIVAPSSLRSEISRSADEAASATGDSESSSES